MAGFGVRSDGVALRLGNELRLEPWQDHKVLPYFGAFALYSRDAYEAAAAPSAGRKGVGNRLEMGPLAGLRFSIGHRFGAFAAAALVHSTHNPDGGLDWSSSRINSGNWVRADFGISLELGGRKHAEP